MATPDIPNFGDGLSEGMKAGEFSGREIFQTVNNSLSQPLDVRAAHQYFSPSSNTGLPDLQTFGGGESLSFSNQTIDFNVGNELAFNNAQSLSFDMAPMNHAFVPTGAEAAAFTPGADAAIAALTPGAEPISPIIQLIMRMPGHIGLLNSFFEALGALFMPLQDMLGAFNFTDWLNHANAGIASSLSSMGEHLPLSLSLLPSNAPIFGSLGQQMGSLGANLANGQMSGLGDIASTSTAGVGNFSAMGDVSQLDLNVGGHADFGKPLYENPLGASNNPHDMTIGEDYIQGQQLAFDNGGGSFRPQLGAQGAGQSVPQSQMPQQQPVVQSQPSSSAGSDFARAESSAQPQSMEQQQLGQQQMDQQQLAQPEGGAQEVAQAQPPAAEASPYTVKPGDNLWDIAHKNLGDGAKWQDIYKLNQDVVGTNPDLIHPGAQLNLGDGSHMTASADYVVKPGDNLWNISKDHLGGGQNWNHLYHQNADVIGNNPSLIHPGQNLHMNGADHHSALADASHGHTTPTHHTAHSPSHHAPAHHTTAHHSAPHHAQPHHSAPKHDAPAAAHDKMAHAKPASPTPSPQAVEASSHQIPQQIAQTPQGGVEQGLKASQSMGSLKDLKITD